MFLFGLVTIFHVCQALPSPQDADCDIFDDCSSKPDCFNTLEDINQSIFDGDTRQAFEDCPTENPTTCANFEEAGFVCAPYWTCQNKSNTIISDGEGLIDVRSDDRFSLQTDCAPRQGTLDSTDKKCPKENEVCCKNPSVDKEPCSVNPPVTEYDQCGRSLGENGLKVTGGNFANGKFAQPGEFPHMCIVYKEEGGQRQYVGGASLIARNLLLTVAHKFWLKKKGEVDVNDFKDPGKFIVRCGEQNVKNEAELLPHQQTTVEKIHIHPDYQPKRLRDNLAILQVTHNFVYQEHIGPVCLPGLDSSPFYGSSDCWSSGWGAEDFTSPGYYSDTLKKIRMAVLTPGACQARLRRHPRLKPSFQLHKSWVCVGGEEGQDTCSGDGGSPHVCKREDGRFVQVGAVNWGLGCGEAVPSIYSSVSDAMCWIDKVMSCLPRAEHNVQTTANNDPRQAGVEVKSVHGFTPSQCGQWGEDYDYVLPNCVVRYQDEDFIEERGVEDDEGRG